MHPLVSIIIPHYNGIRILDECLDSLKECRYPHLEILVVDNGSTDNSVQFLQDNYPRVRIIRNLENLGFAEGCNRGILNASGDLVLILNNDTIHEPDWIKHLTATLLSDPAIAIVQPKILSYQNRHVFDYSGASGGFIDYFAYPFARGRIFYTIERDSGQYDEKREIFWASGTAFLARKEIIVKAGLFDTIFFAHMEEIDLDWHIHQLGYKIVVEPKAVIYHRSGYTLHMESYKKKYLNHRNSLIMLSTNYQLGNLFWIMPIRIALELLAFCASAVKFDFHRMLAIIHALLWLVSHPLYIVRKRKWVKSQRILSDRTVMQRMIRGPVSLGYFLFRRRYFYQWYHS
jgi:GT2 family glycosyltransferase